MQRLAPKDKLNIIRDEIGYQFEVAGEGGFTLFCT